MCPCTHHFDRFSLQDYIYFFPWPPFSCSPQDRGYSLNQLLLNISCYFQQLILQVCSCALCKSCHKCWTLQYILFKLPSGLAYVITTVFEHSQTLMVRINFYQAGWYYYVCVKIKDGKVVRNLQWKITCGLVLESTLRDQIRLQWSEQASPWKHFATGPHCTSA